MAEVPSGLLSHSVLFVIVDIVIRQHFMTEGTGTGTGKVHPITGHEGPEVE